MKTRTHAPQDWIWVLVSVMLDVDLIYNEGGSAVPGMGLRALRLQKSLADRTRQVLDGACRLGAGLWYPKVFLGLPSRVG